MGFKINLDDVEPWTPGGLILRAGSHPVRVVKEEIQEPGDEGFDNDHPVVILTLEAVGGEEKGGEIRDWVHITQEALGRVAQIYKAFGVKLPGGEFEWISLIGKGNAKAVVREKPGRRDPSKTFSEVASYDALSDADRAASTLEEGMGAKPVASGQVRDEDIPF